MFRRTILASALLFAASAASGAATEVKGAAILDHACGQLTVKHMDLVHAGKMDEAVKLATPEMQAEWKAMAAEEREMVFSTILRVSRSAQRRSAAQSAAAAAGALSANGRTT